MNSVSQSNDPMDPLFSQFQAILPESEKRENTRILFDASKQIAEAVVNAKQPTALQRTRWQSFCGKLKILLIRIFHRSSEIVKYIPSALTSGSISAADFSWLTAKTIIALRNEKNLKMNDNDLDSAIRSTSNPVTRIALAALKIQVVATPPPLASPSLSPSIPTGRDADQKKLLFDSYGDRVFEVQKKINRSDDKTIQEVVVALRHYYDYLDHSYQMQKQTEVLKGIGLIKLLSLYSCIKQENSNDPLLNLITEEVLDKVRAKDRDKFLEFCVKHGVQLTRESLQSPPQNMQAILHNTYYSLCEKIDTKDSIKRKEIIEEFAIGFLEEKTKNELFQLLALPSPENVCSDEYCIYFQRLMMKLFQNGKDELQDQIKKIVFTLPRPLHSPHQISSQSIVVQWLPNEFYALPLFLKLRFLENVDLESRAQEEAIAVIGRECAQKQLDSFGKFEIDIVCGYLRKQLPSSPLVGITSIHRRLLTAITDAPSKTKIRSLSARPLTSYHFDLVSPATRWNKEQEKSGNILREVPLLPNTKDFREILGDKSLHLDTLQALARKFDKLDSVKKHPIIRNLDIKTLLLLFETVSKESIDEIIVELNKKLKKLSASERQIVVEYIEAGSKERDNLDQLSGNYKIGTRYRELFPIKA